MSKNNVVKFLGFLTILLFSINAAFAKNQDKIWEKIDDSMMQMRSGERMVIPLAYTAFKLNKTALRETLSKAPMEFSDQARQTEVILSFPMPDGTFSRFKIEESPIMEAPLAAKFPEIKTYRGQGIDDPSATVRFDLMPSGFHSMILSTNGTVMVDPYFKDDTTNYISYFKRDVPKTEGFSCGVNEANSLITQTKDFLPDVASPNVMSGSTLRTYRLALAATGEYTAAVGGGTVAGALAAQVLIMNRVNGVYERDLALRMVVVANNNLVIYTDGATDPYTNSNGVTMLTENQTNLDSVIGSANYDIGHVFSTGGGGVATLNGPCGGSKARGVTGLPNPVGDPFAIDYVAHEMGHQWGANHTFNGSVGSCAGGNRSAASAYEPGSGITIMAYAGICGNQDLALNSIDTFHVRSLEAIVAFSQTGNGNTCAVSTSTGNTPPTVSVAGGATYNIPKQTPFALTASATDPNGDTLTYDWQQYDLGSATTTVPNTDADGLVRPIFRPYLPSSGPTRNFPSLTYILNNGNNPPATTNCPPRTNCLLGEQLPNITRTMNFQVVVRDNRAGGGGINTATATLSVDGNSGPFVVTSPSTKVSWTGGSTQLIGWSVANTNAAPINAANVKISLSTDGGQTFPTVLANSTPNDGAEAVTLPATVSSNIRIKVEPVGNVFFDISDVRTRYDFDGDARTDLSVYRDGVWYVQRSQLGFTAASFGVATDKTVAADYDGDGRTDFAIFRDGVWYVLRSTLGLYIAQFGAVGDIPVPGDYNGDGRADLAVFRAGVWYIFHTNDSTVRVQPFGNATDKPVVGDFDGDGRQDLAVYRSGTWFALRSQLGSITVPFGIATDIPVPADYDGDGKTDYAVYRNGIWYLLRSQDGTSIQSFGIAADVPTPADYDGDGKADLSVFRNGIWYLQQTTSGFSASSFGLASDKPIPAQSN